MGCAATETMALRTSSTFCVKYSAVLHAASELNWLLRLEQLIRFGCSKESRLDAAYMNTGVSGIRLCLEVHCCQIDLPLLQFPAVVKIKGARHLLLVCGSGLSNVIMLESCGTLS